METKVCTTCGIEKPLSEFHKDRTHKDGLRSCCKLCVKNSHVLAKDKISAQRKGFRQRYKERVNAWNSQRKAWKLKATPSWADREAIASVYEATQAFKLYTGLDYHVDHIVPLRSPLVCGLHVPANLQVMEARENIRKSNKHWPDMP